MKTLEERKAEIEECTRLLNELTELIGSDEDTCDFEELGGLQQ